MTLKTITIYNSIHVYGCLDTDSGFLSIIYGSADTENWFPDTIYGSQYNNNASLNTIYGPETLINNQ